VFKRPGRPGHVSKLSMSKKRKTRTSKKRHAKGHKPKASPISSAEVKYFDLLSLANSIGAGATLFPLSIVPQGSAQSTRVGDFIRTRRLVFNYSLYTVNSDIVTTVRLIFFRWHPSTALAFPVVANILESPVSSNVLSHYNFQLQEDYTVLWERQYNVAGTTTAPTVTSSIGATGQSVPLKGNNNIDFSLASTMGSNLIYLLAISDSSLTPFPLLNFSTRLYYEDTVKGSTAKMIK